MLRYAYFFKSLFLVSLFMLLTACGGGGSATGTSPVQKSLSTIANYSQGASTIPTVTDYQNIGATAVTTEDVADINFLVRSLSYDEVNTEVEIQAAIQRREEALALIMAYANSHGTSTPPTIETYRAIGVTGVTDENREAINALIAALVASDVDTGREIDLIVQGYTPPTEDTTPPVITLEGNSSITLSLHTPYTEPGATAIDDVDGVVSVSIRGTIDIHTIGNYVLTYSASDSAGNEANVIRMVQVREDSTPNQAPTATAQSVSTDEDTAIAITLAGTDPEGDVLSYTVLSDPSSGVLSGTAPNLTYTPNSNTNGNDSFTFKVNDGALDSAEAMVSIVVNPVNDLPTADAGADQSVEVNSSVNLTGSGSDVEGAVSYAWSEGASTLGNNATLSYTPTTVGDHLLTLTVTDGEGASSSDTVTVTATAVPNQAPTATAQSVSTDEDTAIAITLAGTDPEGDVLSYTVLSDPSSGVLSGTAPNLTYTPSSNTNGNDSFTFKVNDGALDSAEATVSITVNPVNDLPTADAGADQTVLVDTNVTLTGNGSDIEGSVTYAWHKEGVELSTSAVLVYTPTTIGDHNLTLTVTDSSGSETNDSVIVKAVAETTSYLFEDFEGEEFVEGSEFNGVGDWVGGRNRTLITGASTSEPHLAGTKSGRLRKQGATLTKTFAHAEETIEGFDTLSMLVNIASMDGGQLKMRGVIGIITGNIDDLDNGSNAYPGLFYMWEQTDNTDSTKFYIYKDDGIQRGWVDTGIGGFGPGANDTVEDSPQTDTKNKVTFILDWENSRVKAASIDHDNDNAYAVSEWIPINLDFSDGAGAVANEQKLINEGGFHLISSNLTGFEGYIIVDDISIERRFHLIPTYHLTYSAETGGTLSGTVDQSVGEGESASAVTAIPNTGYHFDSWDDGLQTPSRKDRMVMADRHYTASFAADLIPDTKQLDIYSRPAMDTLPYDGETIPDSPKVQKLNTGDTLSLTLAKGEYRSLSFLALPVNFDGSGYTLTIEDFAGSINSNSMDHSIADTYINKVWYQSGGLASTAMDTNESSIHVTPELLLKDEKLVIVDHTEHKDYLRVTYNDTNETTYVDVSVRGYSVFFPEPTTITISDTPTLMPFDFIHSRYKLFWMILHIPEDAAADTYTSTAIIRDALGSEIARVPLSITVLPFDLNASKLRYSLFYDGKIVSERTDIGYLSSYIKTEQQFRLELQDQLNHGVKYPLETHKDVVDGERMFKKAVGIRAELGFPADRIYTTYVNFLKYKNNDDFTSARDRAQIFMDDLHSYPEFNQTTLYVYGWDELRDETYLTKEIDYIKAIHEIGAKFYVSGRWEATGILKGYADMIDMPHGTVDDRYISEVDPWHNDHPDENSSEFIDDNGTNHYVKGEMFVYASQQAGIEDPQMYRREYGCKSWQIGYDGVMNYAYEKKYGVFWNDFDKRESDRGRDWTFREENYVYPTTYGVVSTMQWEGFREAINDERYITTLENLRDTLRASGHDTDADAIDTFLNGIDCNSDLDQLREDIINKIMLYR